MSDAETKVCTRCLKEKSLTSFNKRTASKDGLMSCCRECSRKLDNGPRTESKIKVINYLKTHPCIDCKEPDPVVLEFDHRDNVTKLGSVAVLIRDHFPWEMIKQEIDKCDVRCGNCHKKRTARQRNFYPSLYVQESK